MADERLTPEKRLLRLIETPKKYALQQVKRSRRGFGSSLDALREFFSFLKERIGLTKRETPPNLIKGMNQVLLLSIVGLGLYLVTDWFTLSINPVRMSYPTLKTSPREGATKPLALLEEASSYSEKANSRDIFKLGFKKVTIVKKEEKKLPAPKIKIISPREELQGIIKDWQLVGVAWSKQPEAMIEDIKSGKTYICSKGKQLKKNIVVIEILKEKVILGYKGEKAELKL